MRPHLLPQTLGRTARRLSTRVALFAPLLTVGVGAAACGNAYDVRGHSVGKARASGDTLDAAVAPPRESSSDSFEIGVDGGVSASPSGDCSDAAKLVYVVSDENTLYSFAPDKLAFTKIGTLACETSANVNSMAVDRSGTAWVNYTDGKIFKVGVADASCAPTPFTPRQAKFTSVLGMGFSSDSPGSSSETLFVSDNAGLGLAKVDLSTMTLTPLGAYTGALARSNAELTGTGDARLFGFFTTKPGAVAAITKATGATPSPTSLPTVDASSGGFAFSFWGGDFWFYTARPKAGRSSPTTSVTHFETATGRASVVLSEIGFVIVGAGVSTCAPSTSPLK